MRSTTFLVGLLSQGAPPFVTAEDLRGPHREPLARWRAMGFIGREPGMHPAPSCPHCGGGVPYRAAGRLLCTACRSPLDGGTLLAWPVLREAFIAALAARLGLPADPSRVDDGLWELGGGRVDGNTVVCLFHAGELLSPPAREYLARFRRTLVVSADPPTDRGGPGRWVSLAGLLDEGGAFTDTRVPDL